ncbi:hypothetical protein BESB_073340 [Besnoitia besnoiti]|uniref:Uncharacterized protein n=1 Tax=Besnoitia besnoiti TaxID=94643 RepID=A0A2A9MFM1_BESBE|nr:uncharacterized protein BESB_073340 [Besnoitia besnoiti]PFH34182.1 hypothetical protein BESB_073340 [Besnoitia besnoiti]
MEPPRNSGGQEGSRRRTTPCGGRGRPSKRREEDSDSVASLASTPGSPRGGRGAWVEARAEAPRSASPSSPTAGETRRQAQPATKARGERAAARGDEQLSTAGAKSRAARDPSRSAGSRGAATAARRGKPDSQSFASEDDEAGSEAGEDDEDARSATGERAKLATRGDSPSARSSDAEHASSLSLPADDRFPSPYPFKPPASSARRGAPPRARASSASKPPASRRMRQPAEDREASVAAERAESETPRSSSAASSSTRTSRRTPPASASGSARSAPDAAGLSSAAAAAAFSFPAPPEAPRGSETPRLPSWVEHYVSVYWRFASRDLSLSAALSNIRGLLLQAADAAASGEPRDSGDASEAAGAEGERRRGKKGQKGAARSARKAEERKEEKEEEEKETEWTDSADVTPERLLEVVFRQALHLCLSLPKLPEREGGRLCAFFYRTLAKLDEMTFEERRKRAHGLASRSAAAGRPSERDGEGGNGGETPRTSGEEEEDPRAAQEEADKATRYRFVEALWCRLLPQLLCRSRAARVGVCCFLLQLVGWGSGVGIEVAESLQQMHRQILLQLLGRSREAATRRMALLLLEHFQTPQPSCVVWRAFLGHLTDEAPAVRRAAVSRVLLLPLSSFAESENHSPETLEFAASVAQLLARRAFDASADVRAAVYRRAANNDNSFSVEQKSLLILTGLNDKAKGVRELCSRALRRWVQLRQPQEDAEKEKPGDGVEAKRAEGDEKARAAPAQAALPSSPAGAEGESRAACDKAPEGVGSGDGAERESEAKSEGDAEFVAFAECGLHLLVDQLMDGMPFNETAIEVLVKELLVRYPLDCRLDLLRAIQRDGGKNLSKLSASGLLILRVYMQTVASEEERGNLDVPELQQLLVKLLAACRHREAEQKKEASHLAAFAHSDPEKAAKLDLFLQDSDKHLLTLNVCLRQLLLLACFVDIAEQQQARLLDEACEQILLKVPLGENRKNRLRTPFGIQSGSVGDAHRAAVPRLRRLGLDAELPLVLHRQCALARLLAALLGARACVQLLRRLQRLLEGRGFTPQSKEALARSQEHESAFSARVCTLIAEVREPLDVSCEDANVMASLWTNAEELDPLTLPVGASTMLTLQEQHAALLQELAGLQQKARDLFEVSSSFRASQDAALENDGKGKKNAREEGQEGRAHMAQAVQQQIRLTQKQFQKTAELALVLNNELHTRWFRISCVLDAFFARSQSNCTVDPALSDIPSSTLLPALEFYCNGAEAFSFCVTACCCEACCSAGGASPARKAEEEEDEGESFSTCWKARDPRLQEAALQIRGRAALHSDLCEVLVTKSLGCFCLLSTRHSEVAKQLKAYHVSLLASLGELQATSSFLHQQISLQQAWLLESRERQERLARRERRLLQLLSEDDEARAREEEEKMRPKEGRRRKREKTQEERSRELDEARRGVAEAAAASSEVSEECEKIAAQIQELESAFTSHMLRCELYVCFLGDLLLSHPALLQSEAARQAPPASQGEGAEKSASLLNLLWHIATGEEASTKQLQSMTLAVLLKLLVLPLAEDERDAGGAERNEDKAQVDAALTQLQRVAADRLRVLMEVVYLQPTLESGTREVMNYVHSSSVWGYSADTKLLCFTILQCFASPLLPAPSARTAFGALFGACRHLAAHGLRGVFSLHLTLQQERRKTRDVVSGAVAVAGGEEELLRFLEEVAGTSLASTAFCPDSGALLPPLAKMGKDLKKLLLFIVRVFRHACFAFAVASLGGDCGLARKRRDAERLSSAPAESEAEKAGASATRETTEDEGTREAGAEKEAWNQAKEYVTRYLELLIVLLLVAEEYRRPLLLLQASWRFFDLVSFAISGWVEAPGGAAEHAGRADEPKAEKFKSLVEIHAACDAPGCLTLLVVVHRLLRDLLESVRSASCEASLRSASSCRQVEKTLFDSLEKLRATLLALAAEHAAELSPLACECEEAERRAQTDDEAPGAGELEGAAKKRKEEKIARLVKSLLERESCADLAQRMKESHHYAVQEQIAAESETFSSPFLTFPFAALDAQLAALAAQETLQTRQRKVAARERRLEEGDLESSEDEIEDAPARRVSAPRRCKQEPKPTLSAHPRRRGRRESEDESEATSSEDEGYQEGSASSGESQEDGRRRDRRAVREKSPAKKHSKKAKRDGGRTAADDSEGAKRTAAARRVKLERLSSSSAESASGARLRRGRKREEDEESFRSAYSWRNDGDDSVSERE